MNNEWKKIIIRELCREIKSAYRPELLTGTPKNESEATAIEPTC
jgi:hypothetical protein